MEKFGVAILRSRVTPLMQVQLNMRKACRGENPPVRYGAPHHAFNGQGLQNAQQ